MAIADELPAWALPMYAAAWQHYDELRNEPVLSRADLVTVDEQLARDSARTALEIIHAYAVQWPVAGASLSGTELVIRQHVVRSRCLTDMHSRWSAAWRDTPAQERAFNSACRALGWFRGRESVTVTLTAAQARELGEDIRGRDRANVPGVLLTSARLAELEAYLLDEGNSSRAFASSRTLPVQPESRLAAASRVPVKVHNAREAPTYDREPSRAQTRIQVQEYREGPETIAAVRAILAEPGVCAIDFETWPTDPDWHAEQAAAAAPRGKKATARERAKHAAEQNGRAHVRRPCVLALAHENGAETLVRLAPGDDPAPRRAELAAMFEGRRASLVAHNAQFEVEVLLAHGVAADLEDSLLAAKCLYLTAVADQQPQPIEFGLADLVEREFDRARDKRSRDRDWRDEASLDEEAAEYCRQDARDALALWQRYRARLEEEGLLEGYEVIRQATLPTAAINIAGMEFDSQAHAVLVRALRAEAGRLEGELGRISYNRVTNHNSTTQISTWIQDEVLETARTPPKAPPVVGLLDFLRRQGGLRPDLGGELAARNLPQGLLSLVGKLNLDEATVAAWEGGYIGHEHDRWSADGTRPEQDELLAAIDRELSGDRVLTLHDHTAWDDYLAEKDRLHRDDPERFANFCARLQAKCGVTWRRTKGGALAITKQNQPQKAVALAEKFPVVAEYLRARVRWKQGMTLLGTFGATLAHRIDGDGRLRGQLKIGGTVTLRHSASHPNIQNMPREKAYRALFRAPPGRALVVCDFSQIELRLAAIIAEDEALLAVYREGRDVHQDVADAIGLPRSSQSKAVSFSMVYGAGVTGVAEASGLSLERAAEVIELFLGAYPGLRVYRERAPREAEAAGFIPMRPGRRVRYDPALSRGTQAINYQVQGAAASVQMRALRRVYDALAARPELDARLVGAIHDELLLEAPADERTQAAAEVLQAEMRTALTEIFPEAAEMGADRLAAATVCASWAEKE